MLKLIGYLMIVAVGGALGLLMANVVYEIWGPTVRFLFDLNSLGDAKVEAAHYCEMVQIWVESGGEHGWPDYRSNCN